MKHQIFGIIVSIICILLPAVGLTESKVPGVTDDEVAIGITCPMSGPAALWSAMGLSNVAWANHINDQGGIHGRKIRVILKDDGYNPSRALANLTEMKDDVLAFGCIIGSATAKASQDFLLQSGVPVVHVHANPRMWVDVPKQKMRHIFVA